MEAMTVTGSHPEATQYVERMGLLWEAQGLPRIAGRMLGYLALQPAPATLDDLAGALGVSKASVSVDARRLEALSLVQRVGRPGDRRDYYVIGENILAHALELKLQSMRRLHEVFVAARRVPDTAPRVRKRLAGMARERARALGAGNSPPGDLRVGPADAADLAE